MSIIGRAPLILIYLFSVMLTPSVHAAPPTTQQQIASCLIDLLSAIQSTSQAQKKTVPPYLRTNLQVDEIDDEFVRYILEQVENFWRTHLQQRGFPFQEIGYTLFRGSIESGCGTVTTNHGFVYCPKDKTVYVDPEFYNRNREFMGNLSGAYFAYALAHEFGHHLQDTLGIIQRLAEVTPGDVETRIDTVLRKREDQADCFAGIFVGFLLNTHQITQSEVARIHDTIIRTSALGELAFGVSKGVVSLESLKSDLERAQRDIHGLGHNRINAFNDGLQHRDPSRCSLDAGIANFAYYPKSPPR